MLDIEGSGGRLKRDSTDTSQLSARECVDAQGLRSCVQSRHPAYNTDQTRLLNTRGNLAMWTPWLL